MIEVKETEQFVDESFVAKFKANIEFNCEKYKDCVALEGLDETHRKIGFDLVQKLVEKYVDDDN